MSGNTTKYNRPVTKITKTQKIQIDREKANRLVAKSENDRLINILVPIVVIVVVLAIALGVGLGLTIKGQSSASSNIIPFFSSFPVTSISSSFVASSFVASSGASISPQVEVFVAQPIVGVGTFPTGIREITGPFSTFFPSTITNNSICFVQNGDPNSYPFNMFGTEMIPASPSFSCQVFSNTNVGVTPMTLNLLGLKWNPTSLNLDPRLIYAKNVSTTVVSGSGSSTIPLIIPNTIPANECIAFVQNSQFQLNNAVLTGTNLLTGISLGYSYFNAAIGGLSVGVFVCRKAITGTISNSVVHYANSFNVAFNTGTGSQVFTFIQPISIDPSQAVWFGSNGFAAVTTQFSEVIGVIQTGFTISSTTFEVHVTGLPVSPGTIRLDVFAFKKFANPSYVLIP